jgi:hypothetical protein
LHVYIQSATIGDMSSLQVTQLDDNTWRVVDTTPSDLPQSHFRVQVRENDRGQQRWLVWAGFSKKSMSTHAVWRRIAIEAVQQSMAAG